MREEVQDPHDPDPRAQCQPDVARPAGALRGLAEDRGIRKWEWLEQPTVS